ncbi:MAG: putative sulfate exporter family transporter [Pseudomonadota bacterium]
MTPAQAVDAAFSAVDTARDGLMRAAPGLFCAGTIAMAAQFLSANLGGPAMLFALLLGMSLNFLADDERCATGLAWSSKNILKIGVALLGAQITLTQVAALGVPVIALVAVGVVFTIVAGAWIGRGVGLEKSHAVLTAGSVAICGASAALAISSVLPRGEKLDQQTSLTVVGVTTLSTIAMILYPLLARAFGFSDEQAGIFIGATIHDVAQVVGAGYTISDEAGETAAIVKLMRVACLVPAVMAIAIISRKDRSANLPSEAAPQLVPFFLIGFLAIMLANSIGLVTPTMTSVAAELSRWALLMAVAALGVRTSIKAMGGLGAAPVMALVLQTVALATLAAVGIVAIAVLA